MGLMKIHIFWYDLTWHKITEGFTLLLVYSPHMHRFFLTIYSLHALL